MPDVTRLDVRDAFCSEASRRAWPSTIDASSESGGPRGPNECSCSGVSAPTGVCGTSVAVLTRGTFSSEAERRVLPCVTSLSLAPSSLGSMVRPSGKLSSFLASPSAKISLFFSLQMGHVQFWDLNCSQVMSG